MYERSAIGLRRMRQRSRSRETGLCTWGDREEKADRVLAYLKDRAMRQPRQRGPVGPYSGLTREELRQSGTCEPDWF